MQLGPPTTLWERTFGSTIIRDQEGFLGLGLTGGTIVGTGTINVLALVHPDGSENFVARWSAPAAVNGQGGTVTVRFLGFDDGTSFSGTLFAAGSQGLRGFLADGHFSGTDATGAGSYTISYVGP